VSSDLEKYPEKNIPEKKMKNIDTVCPLWYDQMNNI
jgi:hypothetical protein